MPNRSLERQRLTALFLVGLMLWFSPLILRAPDAGTLLGIPVLYLYLFGSWALLLALAALILARGRD
jgi:hypothetical protein